MGDVVAFVNLRISEGHLRQLMLTQGQRGLRAARGTAIPETGPPLWNAQGGHDSGRAGPLPPPIRARWALSVSASFSLPASPSGSSEPPARSSSG